MLSSFLQRPAPAASAVQLYFGRSPHATREPTSCPTGHQTDKPANRFPFLSGKNSRKSAPSTGRFPPTPVPIQAKSAAVVAQEFALPTASPKVAAMARVALNYGITILASSTEQHYKKLE